MYNVIEDFFGNAVLLQVCIKSYLIAALTLLSEDSPVTEDLGAICWAQTEMGTKSLLEEDSPTLLCRIS